MSSTWLRVGAYGATVVLHPLTVYGTFVVAVVDEYDVRSAWTSSKLPM